MSGKYIARHPFHLVDASPWPFYASICAFGATFGGVCYMHDYANGGALLTVSGILLVSGMPQIQDHLLGVEVLTEYLARKGEVA